MSVTDSMRVHALFSYFPMVFTNVPTTSNGAASYLVRVDYCRARTLSLRGVLSMLSRKTRERQRDRVASPSWTMFTLRVVSYMCFMSQLFMEVHFVRHLRSVDWMFVFSSRFGLFLLSFL